MKKAYFILLLTFIFCFFTNGYSQLQADFVADTTKGCGNLAGVKFTDISTGNPTSWLWNFGNNNTSTLQNPTASYTTPGLYTVTLTVNDGVNPSSTETKTSYIEVFTIPTANFTFTPSGGCSPLTVNFTNTSTLGSAPIQSFIWDFKDGAQNPGIGNPTHTYQTATSYNPNLQIIDQNGCTDNITSATPIVVTSSPIASFSTVGPRLSCKDTLTVQFTNSSSGFNLSYMWDFGDGSTSTLAAPVHKYNGFNSYDVTLTVTDPNCSNTFKAIGYIKLEDPNAAFTTAKKEYCFGEKVNFNNTSTGGNVYSWTFGDGTFSSEVNPTKIYADSGFFPVKLVISGAGCISQFFDTLYVQRVIADFTTDTTFSCKEKDSVFFTSTSTNAISYQWLIGEDSTKTDSMSSFIGQRVAYQNLPREGKYNDALIVTSSLGCKDTLKKIDNRRIDYISVEITELNRGILDDNEGGCFPLSFDFNSAVKSPVNILSYSWDFGNTQTSTMADPTAVQTYTTDTLVTVILNIVGELGCTAKDTVAILPGKILPLSIYIDPDSLCKGDSIIIRDTSMYTLSYKSEIFFKDSLGVTIDERIAHPDLVTIQNTDLPGTHAMRITQSYNGCAVSDSLDSLITILGPLVKLDYTWDCNARNQISFIGEVINGTRFYWDFGDSSTFDSTNLNPIHIYTQPGNYTAKLYAYNDTNKCPENVDSLLISIRNQWPLDILPFKRQFCLDEMQRFNVADTGIYDTVMWKYNGQLVTEEKLWTKTFDTRGTFSLEVYAVDFSGCSNISFDTFYISRPIVDFDTTILQACFPPEVQLLNNSVLDTLVSEYFWTLGDKDTLRNIDTIKTFNIEGSKDIFLRVENIFGCEDSILKTDYIVSKDFDVKALFTGNQLLCEGDSITFRNTSSDTTDVKFVWRFGDGDSLISKDEFVGHRFTSGGNYTVKLIGSDKNNCVKTAEIPVIIDDYPSPAFAADTLTANCYPLAVNFFDTTIQTGAKWEWRFGDGDTSFLQNPFHNFTTPGNFDIFLKITTPNGCIDSITKSAYIQTTGPTADYTINKNIACINEPLQFSTTNQQNVDSHFWDFGDGNGVADLDNATHAYSKTGKIYFNLILTDVSGTCSVTLTDSVTILDIKADFIIEQDSGCSPFSTEFTNASTGENAISWNFGNGTTSMNQVEQIEFTNAGVYTISLAINSDEGCRDTAIKTVTVFQTPLAGLVSDTGLCFGDTVLLSASGGDSYQWFPPDFVSQEFSSTTLAFPDTTSILSVAVGIGNTCFDTAQVSIAVIQNPIPLGLQDSAIIIGEEVNLSLFAGPNFNYSWSPPTGLSCADCPSPVFKPLENQRYIVTISDAFGCFSVSDTIDFTVEEAYSLDVPNAFSPNGDGINDIIYAKGWGLKELISFKIYNRFGELVFESQDFENGWDGIYRGKPQNIETYIYTVEALTYGDKILTKKGNISLLR